MMMIRGVCIMFGANMSHPSTPPTQPCRHFELSEILKVTNNFDKSSSSFIGRAHFGEVYQGAVFIEGITVPAAIRRLDPEFIESWPWPQVEKLYNMPHPNLVNLIGFCYYSEREPQTVTLQPPSKVHGKEKKLYGREKILVHEYVSNGTLKDHLHALRTPLSWLRRLNICIGVARALRFLHADNERHGDIRSSNILLTQSFQAKLSKFGLADVGPTHLSSTRHITFPVGTFGYTDPYSTALGCVTIKSDHYSFGIVLLELLFRRPPCGVIRSDVQQRLVNWVNAFVTETNLADMIDSDIRNEISPECLLECFRLAKRCLLEEPEERPDMREVVSSLESLLVSQEEFNYNLFMKGRMVDTLPIPDDSDSRSPGPRVKKFAFSDLNIATRGFSPDLALVEGNVFLGWLEHNTLAPSEEGDGIAVAVISITPGIPQSYDTWLEEVNFLGQLDHPNLIKFMGYSTDGDKRLLVYKYMKTTLSDLIHIEEPLSWKIRVCILIEIACGLTYLYSEKGVVCHIQCDDILLDKDMLLDKDFRVKIGGFIWEKVQGIRLNGVFGYLKADYQTSTGKLPMKDDICSFGFVLLEVITGRHNKDLVDVLAGMESLEMQAPKSKSNKSKLKELMDPRLKGSYSLEGAVKCMALAKKCIAAQPNYRPTREEILWSLQQIYALNK